MKHSHTGVSSLQQDTAHASKVTLVGALFDAQLGIVKIITGVLGHSAALVADGVHSLSDLATDLVVLISIRLGGRAPDQNHPFGHRRIETLGTVILGLTLLAVALGLIWQNALSLWQGHGSTVPTWPVLLVAGLSFGIKEGLYWYTIKAARTLHSELLSANAWHSRSDAFSSIVVLLGAGGAMLGVWWLDAVAAMLVALLIGWISLQLLAGSLAELIDTAVPIEQQQAYRAQIMQIQGIIAVNALRSRTSGGKVLLELKLEVAPRLSASEAHWLGNQVKQQLKQQFADIGDILVHINSPGSTLPKQPITSSIRPALQQAVATVLHSYQLEASEAEIFLYYQQPVRADILLSPKAQISLAKIGEKQLQHQLQQVWPQSKQLHIHFYQEKSD